MKFPTMRDERVPTKAALNDRKSWSRGYREQQPHDRRTCVSRVALIRADAGLTSTFARDAADSVFGYRLGSPGVLLYGFLLCFLLLPVRLVLLVYFVGELAYFFLGHSEFFIQYRSSHSSFTLILARS